MRLRSLGESAYLGHGDTAFGVSRTIRRRHRAVDPVFSCTQDGSYLERHCDLQPDQGHHGPSPSRASPAAEGNLVTCDEASRDDGWVG